jgi:predicted nucleic acid-binding protein
MKDRYFLDTNIVVYSFDRSDPRKMSIGENLVTRGVGTGLGTISYQVVQEFFNVALRRFRSSMTLVELEQFFFRVLQPMMKVSSTPALYLEALALQEAHQLHWYDALVVTAAMKSKCKTLYSEDLQHGRRFGDLVIKNPFF